MASVNAQLDVLIEEAKVAPQGANNEEEPAASPLISHWHDQGGYVTAYMCLTDFTDELGAAAGGNTVYPSIRDLKENRKCVDQCGIAEVKVVGVRLVQPFNRDHASVTGTASSPPPPKQDTAPLGAILVSEAMKDAGQETWERHPGASLHSALSLTFKAMYAQMLKDQQWDGLGPGGA